jgi:hypothetical protein
MLVSLGEIEHACALAEAALAGSNRLSSNRVLELCHALRAQLEPHAFNPVVEPIAQSLSTAVATRAHCRLLVAVVGNPEH